MHHDYTYRVTPKAYEEGFACVSFRRGLVNNYEIFGINNVDGLRMVKYTGRLRVCNGPGLAY